MTTIVGHIRNGFLDRMASFSPAAVMVWLALANHADEAGGCYPSISAIQDDTGLARSTVHKAIDELVHGGEISVDPGGGKGNPSNHYRFIGSPGNELVQKVNQSKRRTKVVRKLNSNQTHEPDGSKRKRFVPPSVDDVTTYCQERKNGIDPERFVASYEAKGWMIGNSKMKDWRAAVRTWERNGFHEGNGRAPAKPAAPIKYRDEVKR
jgi:hypothetical protein